MKKLNQHLFLSTFLILSQNAFSASEKCEKTIDHVLRKLSPQMGSFYHPKKSKVDFANASSKKYEEELKVLKDQDDANRSSFYDDMTIGRFKYMAIDDKYEMGELKKMVLPKHNITKTIKIGDKEMSADVHFNSNNEVIAIITKDKAVQKLFSINSNCEIDSMVTLTKTDQGGQLYDYFSSKACGILPVLTKTADEISPIDMVSDYEYRCIEQGGKLGAYKACLCENDASKEIGAYDGTCNKDGVPNQRQEIPFTKMSRLLNENDTTLNPPYKENLPKLANICENFAPFFPSDKPAGKSVKEAAKTLKK